MLSLQCDVNTTESLQRLRDRNELCDLVIVSNGGKQTLAHSCILAIHSSVIASVLQSRISTDHDWSILRPLVINIDEVSVKDAAKEDSEGDTNIIEMLVSLMYGETVNIADAHVPLLNEYAHVLGLSDQIFTCLDGTDSRNARDVKKECGEKNIQTVSKCEEMEYEHVEVLSEISLENQIFPSAVPKSPQIKGPGNETVVGTYEVKDVVETYEVKDPENVVSFSMLCPEGQVDDEACGKAWQEETLSYEKPTDIQGQECKIVVCKMEQDSAEKLEGGQGKSQAESAILNITLPDQSQTTSYCGDSQPLHQQKKQPKKSFICSVCNSAFQKCCDLVKHVQTLQHFTVQCPLCFIQIEDVEGQRVHFAEHDQELPFFCVYCNLRFRTRAALTMHTPKHMTMKPFVCNDCGRGFKWRHALHAHLLTHSSTSRLLCDICGFSSKYVTSFKAHLLQHSGQSFLCPHPGCSFTSNRKTHLNDHLATHSKTRVHQCEVCGHSFSNARNMHRHMRLHAPASNLLTCVSVSKLQCNFRTTRPDKLRDHMLRKHNMKYDSLPSKHISKTKLVKSSTTISSDQPVTCDKSPVSDYPSKSNIHLPITGTVQSCVQSAKPGTILVGSYDRSSVEVGSSGLGGADTLNFQEAADIITANKFDQSNKLELLDSIKSDNKIVFQSSHTVVKDLSSDATEEHFSHLISSNIVELPDIQALENHSGEAGKDQEVSEISGNFPSVFLIEPEMLLEKTESSSMPQPCLSTKDEMHVLQTSVLPTSTQKVMSVNAQESDAQINVIGEHTVSALYSGQCSLTESQDNDPLGGVDSSSVEASVDNSLEDRNLKEVADEKEEQCMESLTILDLMLNNVTG